MDDLVQNFGAGIQAIPNYGGRKVNLITRNCLLTPNADAGEYVA